MPDKQSRLLVGSRRTLCPSTPSQALPLRGWLPCCRVLYLDKASGQQLPARVTDIDVSLDPPSYTVLIHSLGATRETVAARLTAVGQVRRAPRARRGGQGAA